MDEKGFVMGFASRSRVICSQLGRRIRSHGKRNVNAAVKIFFFFIYLYNIKACQAKAKLSVPRKCQKSVYKQKFL